MVSSETEAHFRLPRLMAALVDGDIRFHFEHSTHGYKLTLPDLNAEEFDKFAKSERLQLRGLCIDNVEV